MEDKQVIKSDDVGSLEEVLGENDPLFHDDKKEEPTGGGHGHNKEDAKVVSAQDFLNDNPIIRDTSIGAKLEEMTIPKEERIKDIPEEVEITHLKNLENGQVFEVNPDLIRRKDLIPCDADGNKVYDNRRLGRFN